MNCVRMAHIMSWFVPLGTRILNKHKGSWFGGFGGRGCLGFWLVVLVGFY